MDVFLQAHAFAPAAGGATAATLVSPLAGLSVARANAPGPAAVTNLTSPVLITIPVGFGVGAGALLGCVYWDSSVRAYASAGCEVVDTAQEEGAVTAIICACSHLTLFAVAQLALAVQAPSTTAADAPAAGSNSSQDQTSTVGWVGSTDRGLEGNGSAGGFVRWRVTATVELRG